MHLLKAVFCWGGTGEQGEHAFPHGGFSKSWSPQMVGFVLVPICLDSELAILVAGGAFVEAVDCNDRITHVVVTGPEEIVKAPEPFNGNGQSQRSLGWCTLGLDLDLKPWFL